MAFAVECFRLINSSLSVNFLSRFCGSHSLVFNAAGFSVSESAMSTFSSFSGVSVVLTSVRNSSAGFSCLLLEKSLKITSLVPESDILEDFVS